MGSMQSEGYAEAVQDGLASLEMALTMHLRSNHYPPVPTSMIPVCMEAIDIYNNGKPLETLIDLPEGVEWRDQTKAPASAVLLDLHLEAFLTEPDEL